MRKCILICILALCIACSSGPVPKGVIEPEKMEGVVYDLMQADELLNNFVPKDTGVDMKKERSMYYGKIFKIHGTNKKQFYTSFKYYQQHPDLQKALFDSLNQKAKRKRPLPVENKPIKLATEQ